MSAAHEIIRAWCASCGMPAPSNGDCIALVAALTAPTVTTISSGSVNAERVIERTTGDRFENAIREYGAAAACEWFGHSADSEFTKETIRVLAERAAAINPDLMGGK